MTKAVADEEIKNNKGQSIITVLGATGFIGSHLVRELEARNLEYYAPPRDADLKHQALGQVIYCIGLTADFRSHPFDTVEAHVCKLSSLLQDSQFDSLTYLSSTRLYQWNQPGLNEGVSEEDALQVSPLNPSDLYNISKAMGESLAFASGKTVRVVRVANVYGDDFTSDNFLAAIIKEAVTTGKIKLGTSLESAKDYISIDDVVGLLIQIAASGSQRLYNVASGCNVSNGELTRQISLCTGCEVEVTPDAPTITFLRMSIQRIQQEFNFEPASVLNDIEKLITSYRNTLQA